MQELWNVLYLISIQNGSAATELRKQNLEVTIHGKPELRITKLISGELNNKKLKRKQMSINMWIFVSVKAKMHELQPSEKISIEVSAPNLSNKNGYGSLRNDSFQNYFFLAATLYIGNNLVFFEIRFWYWVNRQSLKKYPVDQFDHFIKNLTMFSINLN